MHNLNLTSLFRDPYHCYIFLRNYICIYIETYRIENKDYIIINNKDSLSEQLITNLTGSRHFKIFKRFGKSGSLTNWSVQNLEAKLKARRVVDEWIVEYTPSKPHLTEGRRVLSHVRKKGTRGCRKERCGRKRKRKKWKPPILLKRSR